MSFAFLAACALQSSYAKIHGKSIVHALVVLNKAVICDLSWFVSQISTAGCVHLLEATIWDAEDAQLSLWCDASDIGLGFWSPAHHIGLISPLDLSVHHDTIFFNEALCVLAALLWTSRLPAIPQHLAIYTDSLNTVQIFCTLHADPPYNSILFLAVEIMLEAKIDLCVFHVPGFNNFIADALSCLLPDIAVSHVPGLSISTFIPTRDVLGALS